MTNRCRYDRDQETYLRDGEPCRTDDYGDPTRHCTARRSCGNHIGAGELTCARCVGRARADVRRIVAIAPLMGIQALGSGVDSEAAYLAAPAADARGWSQRRVAMASHLLTWEALERITPKQYHHARATMEDDDEQHPYTVLTRWQMMLAEDYGHPLAAKMSTTDAGAYLERALTHMAQDDGQDFALFAREMRQCRDHLESVLRNSSKPTRGAPCPDCRQKGHVVRLQQEFGHWCDDAECERQYHHLDDAGDRWVCPADRDHWMTQEGYAEWLKDRHGTRPHDEVIRPAWSTL